MMFDFETRAKLTKPCPFCGSREQKTFSRTYYEEKCADSGALRIACESCGAELWNHPFRAMEYKEAVRLAVMNWNRRKAA